MQLIRYAWVLPLLPLAVFAFVLATGRRTPRLLPAVMGIAASGAVFLGSLVMLMATAAGEHYSASVSWLTAGPLSIDVGFNVDPLSAVMVAVVASVSTLVQLYSIGYMHGEERFRWYYGAISLFTAAMLGVVLADSWLLMYMCWELMGLASYLLIGFWWETEKASKAAFKAFLVTRIGDIGFGLGLVLMWLNTGSFRFEPVIEAVESGAWAGPTLLAASLLLFMGAMGKSAQFPLHVWLPDAMAGPTPGSALIHAATMVAAGVYLVARSIPLFEANPMTLTIVGSIGTITALMGALIALAQTDIKKVLAYSTISQLGYMFLALGTGNWVAAIFHLMTHAFFKALLFLAAGSVIHATETQELAELGGLWKKMPWTTATWCLGALSLAGIPPLAGFWSKDEILLSALHAGQWGPLVAGVLTAALTAFYMGRTTFLAFFVKPGPKSRQSHAHESPWVMTAPLVVLGILAALIGLVGSPVTGYAFGGFMGEHAEVEASVPLLIVAIGVALGGIALAWSSYIKRFIAPDGYFRLRFVSGVLAEGFHLDRAYRVCVVTPTMAVCEGLRRFDHTVVDGVVRGFGHLGLAVSGGLAWFDRSGIDRSVDGLGDSVTGSGRTTRRIQTGNVQTYLFLLVASIVFFIILAVFSR